MSELMLLRCAARLDFACLSQQLAEELCRRAGIDGAKTELHRRGAGWVGSLHDGGALTRETIIGYLLSTDFPASYVRWGRPKGAEPPPPHLMELTLAAAANQVE